MIKYMSLKEDVMFDLVYLKSMIHHLFSIDSPSGFTKNATAYLEKEIKELGYETHYTQSGNLVCTIKGMDNIVYGVGAHLDTLGLMVRSIQDNGKLNFEKIGGPNLNTLDGEYCRIYTRNNKIYTGTILSKSPSSHVFLDALTRERNEENMEIRLDEIVYSKEDTQKLGIETGDYICIDPKTTITENGFVKSRFIDDKISCCILMGVLKYLHDNQIIPYHTFKFIFSTYEEVGHGSSYIEKDIVQFLAVDMGCIGLDLSCTEQDVSICAKDSSGPYDYDMVSNLIELSKKNQLSYAVDIYPKYSSDASAAQRGGNNIRTALIGPGVHASHGMERCHMDGILNTMKLLYAYMIQK